MPFKAIFIDGTVTISGSIYIWNFGDDYFSPDHNAMPAYPHSGSYQISLTVVIHECCVSDLGVPNPFTPNG